jgi:CIC family chloride channel protein
MKKYRQRLSDESALLPLSFLGVFVGLLTGSVIQVFRYAIEWPGDYFYGYHEAFESLSPELRFALPLYGALTMGLFLQFIIRRVPSIGLPHVVQHLNQHHGRLPLRPALLQFLLGSWCILTGQSSGREGPAIHLGAAASSLLGQAWRLPSNSIRVLTGCGTAAAIAASFNTPIAGVIFAMEVVMMEYAISSFIPVILAASAGTIVSHIVYGPAPAFIIPPLAEHSFYEVPAFILIGVGIGIASALFCYIHKQGLRLHHLPLWLRLSMAGLITGSIGFVLPQVLGIGYDTLDLALEAKLGLYLLLAIGFAKIIATAVSSGLGMPISTIGPTLVIGGCLGGGGGILINYLSPHSVANDSFYIMLGMGAMMGAVLNAPLAAVIALLELTNTPDIILPAMIAIVTATLINTQVFKQLAPHTLSLNTLGQRSQLSMFEIALQRVGVSSLMNCNIQLRKSIISKIELQALFARKLRWLVLEESQQLTLVNAMQLELAFSASENLQALDDEDTIDLLAMPGEQINLVTVHFQASALEAWQAMAESNSQAAFILGSFDAYAPEISGIITHNDLEEFYQKPRVF